MVYVGSCLCRECRCGNEYALLGSLTMKGPDEFLDLRSTDRSVPFFCLQVNNIKSKTVLADHAIDTLVAGPTNGLACVPSRASVPHFQKEFDDKALKELRRRRFDAVQ